MSSFEGAQLVFLAAMVKDSVMETTTAISNYNKRELSFKMEEVYTKGELSLGLYMQSNWYSKEEEVAELMTYKSQLSELRSTQKQDDGEKGILSSATRLMLKTECGR